MSVDRLDDLPPLREVIAAYGLRAERSLGQNFILDQNITDKIVRGAGDLKGFHVLEIGPGPGGLTRSILKAGAKTVTVVEVDRRAIQPLEELRSVVGAERLKIVQADALEVDMTSLAPHPRKVIANLPYNIATPLLVGWLKNLRSDAQAFHSMTLMFQKEVAQRIVAVHGSKSYGRLSILAQWICDINILFNLNPSVFTPPPKVKSSVVHFLPRRPEVHWPSFEAVESLTAAAFSQRRKMIRTSLKDYDETLEKLFINKNLRPEMLDVETFLKIVSYNDG